MMKIIKLVTFCGIFEVGQQGVEAIYENKVNEGQYIVIYESNHKTKRVDVISRDVLVYRG